MEIVKSNNLFTLEEGPYIIEVESVTGDTGDEFYDAWLRHKYYGVKLLVEHEFAPIIGTPQDFIAVIEEELEESISIYREYMAEEDEEEW